MAVPEGIDLSWAVIVFLGSGAVGVFFLSWRLFSMRNSDHVKIAADLNKVKITLELVLANNKTTCDEKIIAIKENLESKIDGKYLSIKKDIDRNERDNDEQYKELHGRMNRGSDELSEVKGDVREVRGELKVISKIVIDKGNA